MNDKTINQKTAKDLLKKGRSLVDSGDFHKALTVLKKALKDSPDMAEIYYETGKALFFLNKYGEASKNYKKALELDPSYPMPYLGLGTVFIRQKKILDADRALKTFLSLDAADDQKVEALWNLGRFYRLYAEKKDSRKLKDILEKLSDYPEIVFSNPRIASEAAKIARLTGESKRSEEIIKRLIQDPLIKQDKFTYNCLLNELEITQKKEIIESKPRSMVAMILDKCNLKCLMCNVWQSQWQAKDKTLREIADWFPYLEDISWEGGEVFMMDGFEDLLAEGGRYKNLSQIIFTNGLMLNETRLRKIADAKADIILSIDGTQKESYEKIRKGATYENLIRILTRIKEFTQTSGNEIKVQINPVIMRSNYKELEGFIKMAAKYGIYAVTFSPIRGIFGDENIFDSQDAEAFSFIRENMPSVKKLARDLGVRLNDWLPVDQTPVSKTTEPTPSLMENDKLFCHSPWQRLTIDNMGSVRPHIFCLNKSIGNVDNMSLEELWNSPGIREYRRRIINRDHEGLCQPECINGQVAENTRDIE